MRSLLNKKVSKDMGILSAESKSILNVVKANLKINLKRYNSMDHYKDKVDNQNKNSSMILLGDVSDASLSLHDFKSYNNSG